MIIVNLSCKNDSGWFSDVENFLERDLKWSGSKIMSISPFSGNLDFKNSKSTDNGRISTDIMILSCKIDRGWFSDVKHCVERDLEWLRSKIMSLWPFYWGFNHCESILDTLRHDAKIYIRGRNRVNSRSQSPMECTTIIFRVHNGSIYEIIPSNTSSVGNEQQFVELTIVRHDIYLQNSD